ncbi:OTU domain-containing protein [Acrasis kona]|uniref:OTU domain-containing protein n=1 Tax=Acrasis kona TaxID=1008807 RepID=A0AAW2ZT45_9EUKA
MTETVDILDVDLDDVLAKTISDEEIADEMLRNKGLRRKPCAKDGSCLFRSISEQLFHSQIYHQDVRRHCVNHIRDNKDLYQFYIVELPFDEYLESMMKDTEWGGQLEVEAIAQCFKCNIRVYSKRGVDAEHTYNGKDVTNPPLIQLCYLNGNHYDSVFTLEFFESCAFLQGMIYDEILPVVFEEDSTSNPEPVYRNVEYDIWKEEVDKRNKEDLEVAMNDGEPLRRTRSGRKYSTFKQTTIFDLFDYMQSDTEDEKKSDDDKDEDYKNKTLTKPFTGVKKRKKRVSTLSNKKKKN